MTRVIINGLWQYSRLGRLAPIRRVGDSLLCISHGMLDPWFKRTYALKHAKKWLYWPWAEYRIMRDAAAVIFTSEQERIEARQSFWLYRVKEQVSALGVESPLPVSASTKEILFDKFPQLKGTRILLFLGRLHPKKGCDLAIEALAANSKSDFSLVLGGPDQIGWEKKLRARVSQLGLESRVVFAGMLQGELKRSALANADALILPSHQENFGMAVVEALSMGIPVLISDRVNIWREIEEDRAGYVGSDDLAGTRSLIERWFDTAHDQKEAMRRNARESFLRRFEINRAVDSLLSILSA